MFYNIRIKPVINSRNDSFYSIDGIPYFVSDIDSATDFYEMFAEAIKLLSKHKITEVITQVQHRHEKRVFKMEIMSQYVTAKHLLYCTADANYEAVSEYTNQKLVFDATLRVLVLLMLKHGKQFEGADSHFSHNSFICQICGQVQDGVQFPAGNMSSHSIVYSAPSHCRYEDCVSHILLPMINPEYKVPDGYFDTAPTLKMRLEKAFAEQKSKKDLHEK